MLNCPLLRGIRFKEVALTIMWISGLDYLFIIWRCPLVEAPMFFAIFSDKSVPWFQAGYTIFLDKEFVNKQLVLEWTKQ